MKLSFSTKKNSRKLFNFPRQVRNIHPPPQVWRKFPTFPSKKKWRQIQTFQISNSIKLIIKSSGDLNSMKFLPMVDWCAVFPLIDFIELFLVLNGRKCLLDDLSAEASDPSWHGRHQEPSAIINFPSDPTHHGHQPVPSKRGARIKRKNSALCCWLTFLFVNRDRWRWFIANISLVYERI